MSEKFTRNTQNNYFDETVGHYLPSYPLIWTVPEEIKNKYTPLYDVMITHYFDSGLLDLQEIGFYCVNQTYAKIEKSIVIRPFAARFGFSPTTIVEMFDQFQDLELASRVCRTNHRGHPNDVVFQPPAAPSELENGGIERLRKQLGSTAYLRKDLGKEFPTQRFSEKAVTKSLGRKAYLAKVFHKFCISSNYHILKRQPSLHINSREYKDLYLPQIYNWCERNDIEYKNDAVVAAALDIAENYGRRPFNLQWALQRAAAKKLEN